MPLPYENSTSGDKAYAEIQKILGQFGCDNYGIMHREKEQAVMIQFDWRGRQVQFKFSWGGYAVAWLREHPHTSRSRSTLDQHKAKAAAIAKVAVCSMARDWVKSQVTAVECNLLSFEEVFMPHMLLPDGRRLVEAAQKLLPPSA
jgi:hypothetical protein